MVRLAPSKFTILIFVSFEHIIGVGKSLISRGTPDLPADNNFICGCEGFSASVVITELASLFEAGETSVDLIFDLVHSRLHSKNLICETVVHIISSDPTYKNVGRNDRFTRCHLIHTACRSFNTCNQEDLHPWRVAGPGVPSKTSSSSRFRPPPAVKSYIRRQLRLLDSHVLSSM